MSEVGGVGRCIKEAVLMCQEVILSLCWGVGVGFLRCPSGQFSEGTAWDWGRGRGTGPGQPRQAGVVSGQKRTSDMAPSLGPSLAWLENTQGDPKGQIEVTAPRKCSEGFYPFF